MTHTADLPPLAGHGLDSLIARCMGWREIRLWLYDDGMRVRVYTGPRAVPLWLPRTEHRAFRPSSEQPAAWAVAQRLGMSLCPLPGGRVRAEPSLGFRGQAVSGVSAEGEGLPLAVCAAALLVRELERAEDAGKEWAAGAGAAMES